MEGDKEADLQKAIGLAKAFSEVFGLELIVRRLTEIGDSVDEALICTVFVVFAAT